MTRRLNFHSANAAAFNSKEPEVVLSGPAGTGKTATWLAKLLAVGDKYPGARMLIVRKTRESLTESVLVTWERDILGVDHPLLTKRPVLRRVRQSYDLGNGSVVAVGGMDKPDKVLSSEWDIIYCPEATDLQLVDWETLGGRLRSGIVPWQQLCGDCNPTTPTHWLYQRSEAGGLKMYTSTHQDNPRFYDRKSGQWTPDGEQYISRLKLMTGARRKRFLEGIWAAAEGLVYDGYDPAIHVHPAGWTAPKDWRRVWGIDWGFVQPLCVQVWAIDGDKRLHLCRELYRTRTRVEAVAKECAAWVESGDEPHPEVILADHDPECIETFRKYGRYKQKDGRERELPVKPADKRDRDKGIQLVQGLFDKQADGKPAIHFAQNTLTHRPDDELRSGGKPTDTRGELVGYVWKVPKPEQAKDEPIEHNDHAMDCMRYVAVHVRRSRVLMS